MQSPFELKIFFSTCTTTTSLITFHDLWSICEGKFSFVFNLCKGKFTTPGLQKGKQLLKFVLFMKECWKSQKWRIKLFLKKSWIINLGNWNCSQHSCYPSQTEWMSEGSNEQSEVKRKTFQCRKNLVLAYGDAKCVCVCLFVSRQKLNNFWLDVWILDKFSQSIQDRSSSIGFGDQPHGAHYQGTGLAKAHFQGSYLLCECLCHGVVT